MSVILITSHDESIYNISSSDASKAGKSPKYRERLLTKKKNLSLSATRGMKAHATMGLPEEVPPDPSDYLKKGTGKCSYSQEEDIKATQRKHICTRKQKLMPTKEEVIQYNRKKEEAEKEEKNFVRKNIKIATTMNAKEPEQKLVLNRFGESKPLTAGLEPIYIKADLLGKTPPYLKEFIKQSEKLHQMKREASGVEKPKCQYITRDQREQLLMVLFFMSIICFSLTYFL